MIPARKTVSFGGGSAPSVPPQEKPAAHPEARQEVFPGEHLVPSLPPDESRDLPTLFAMMGFVSYGAPRGRAARLVRFLAWPLAWVFDALFSFWGAWMLRRALLRRNRPYNPDE